MRTDNFIELKKGYFIENEGFNNTILLMSMVKSECYYIVRFSRKLCMIEFAFDFESEFHTAVSESVMLDFLSDKDYIIAKSKIKNIDTNDFARYIKAKKLQNFSLNKEDIFFKYKIKKDRIVPISIKIMNCEILQIKKLIVSAVEDYYRFKISGSDTKRCN